VCDLTKFKANKNEKTVLSVEIAFGAENDTKSSEINNVQYQQNY